MKNIIWLASYPKSGNTWFRMFLNALLNPDKSLDINKLDETTAIASSRAWFDSVIGYDSAELSENEIERLRPRVYEHAASQSEEKRFHKIHDAYTYTDRGEPLVSASASLGAIYIVRNPFDVCVSYAHHKGQNDVSKVLSLMTDGTQAGPFVPKKKQQSQLRQKLLTWGEHVESWANAKEVPCCVIRYEDMQSKPLETFGKALQFAGIEATDQDILTALEKCSFPKLQQQEDQGDFKERPHKSKKFFRQGKIGSWRNELPESMLLPFVEKHHNTMRKFGYLDENNNIVY
ncbi:Uncharacterised protein [BD1-7 clade bacterium]|uniref:Sulfotransferase domain-containing protein n=1 Tax=BD1-7 clade bacterium TaxID=2029982 RepID=A0A5S9NNG9_9GAMM|nr:Uncharacterised protein [BD1-7 clade bacterium]CAA0094919.1 Uncharacterised protein [BD1-7 clade bacterium]